jgi:hypothetical protein
MLASALCDYFPITLNKDEEEWKDEHDGDKYKGPYMFILHPHGVLGFSHFTNFTTGNLKKHRLNCLLGIFNVFPSLNVMMGTLNLNLCIPIVREFILNRGFMSVDKQSIHTFLNSNGDMKWYI